MTRAATITEETLGRLVGRFYARVREDALLGPVFNGAITEWPEHLDRLQAFWSSVMLTTGRYKGRPLPAHLRHAPDLTAEAFERWLTLWKQTSEEIFAEAPAAALQEKAGRIAESLALGVRYARSEAA